MSITVSSIETERMGTYSRKRTPHNNHTFKKVSTEKKVN